MSAFSTFMAAIGAKNVALTRRASLPHGNDNNDLHTIAEKPQEAENSTLAEAYVVLPLHHETGMAAVNMHLLRRYEENEYFYVEYLESLDECKSIADKDGFLQAV
jgi:hypothetical protein